MKKYVFINDKTTSATMQNLQSAQQAKTKHKTRKRKESDTQKRRAINKYKS